MDEKKFKEIMSQYYDEEGNMTEQGKQLIKEAYALAAEFELELNEVCNKYIRILHPELFGFVWAKMEDGIKLVHAMNAMPQGTPPPPGNIFG